MGIYHFSGSKEELKGVLLKFVKADEESFISRHGFISTVKALICVVDEDG